MRGAVDVGRAGSHCSADASLTGPHDSCNLAVLQQLEDSRRRGRERPRNKTGPRPAIHAAPAVRPGCRQW